MARRQTKIQKLVSEVMNIEAETIDFTHDLIVRLRKTNAQKGYFTEFLGMFFEKPADQDTLGYQMMAAIQQIWNHPVLLLDKKALANADVLQAYLFDIIDGKNPAKGQKTLTKGTIGNRKTYNVKTLEQFAESAVQLRDPFSPDQALVDGYSVDVEFPWADADGNWLYQKAVVQTVILGWRTGEMRSAMTRSMVAQTLQFIKPNQPSELRLVLPSAVNLYYEMDADEDSQAELAKSLRVKPGASGNNPMEQFTKRW